MAQPQLGYGQQTEASIDAVNTWMRSTPWYQQQMRAWGQDPGHPTLTKQQSAQILKMAQAQGVVVDEGDLHIDDHGNFNQVGHGLRNALIVTGIAAAALTGFGAAGIGPLAGALGGGGGASAAAGAGTIGEAASGVLPSTAVSALGTLPAATAGISSAAIPAAAGAAGTVGAVAPAVAHGAGMAINPNTLFTGGTQLFGNLFGAWMQGNAADKAAQAETAAAKYAADLSDAANKRAELFSRQQAENAFQNSEAARRGNYDIYAAGQRRLGTLGEEVGLGPREIPGYVGGVDPQFTGPGAVGTAAGGAPPDLGAIKAKFDQLFPGETLTPEMLAAHRSELEAMGFRLNPNAAGRITDLTLPGGYNLDPIQGAGSGLNKKQWLVSAPGAGGSAAPVAPAAPRYVAPTVPFLGGVQPAPGLGYFGSY